MFQIILTNIILIIWYFFIVKYFHGTFLEILQGSLLYILILFIIFLLSYFLFRKYIALEKENNKSIIFSFLSISIITFIIILSLFFFSYNNPFNDSTFAFYLNVWVIEEYIKYTVVLISLIILLKLNKGYANINFSKFISFYILTSIIFWISEIFLYWPVRLLWIFIHISYIIIPFTIFLIYYKVFKLIDISSNSLYNYKYLFLILFFSSIFLHTLFDFTIGYNIHTIIVFLLSLIWIIWSIIMYKL